jgi:hypothetical protein
MVTVTKYYVRYRVDRARASIAADGVWYASPVAGRGNP